MSKQTSTDVRFPGSQDGDIVEVHGLSTSFTVAYTATSAPSSGAIGAETGLTHEQIILRVTATTDCFITTAATPVALADGTHHYIPLGREQDIRKIQFSDKERTVRAVTWGDLSTAYRSTGIPNITTYFPMPKKFPNLLKSLGVSVKDMFTDVESKKRVYRWIEENVHGPDKNKQETLRSYIWASAQNEEGQKAQAWLETMESYRFTAVTGVKCVEKLFEINPLGALTPAMAFGADLVLELPKTVRLDSII